MSTVLHLDSSARREASVSRGLSRFFVEAWLDARPDDRLVYRDLVVEQLPVVSDQWVTAAYAGHDHVPHPHDDAVERFALGRSDTLVDELVAADLVVVGAPVYNFTVPAALKAWIDLVARVGRTFAYRADGVPVGLLSGKRVVVTASSGSGPALLAAMGMDHHTAYLRGFFAFLGITDVQVVSAWGRDPGTVGSTVSAARASLLELVPPSGPPAPRTEPELEVALTQPADG